MGTDERDPEENPNIQERPRDDLAPRRRHGARQYEHAEHDEASCFVKQAHDNQGFVSRNRCGMILAVDLRKSVVARKAADTVHDDECAADDRGARRDTHCEWCGCLPPLSKCESEEDET